MIDLFIMFDFATGFYAVAGITFMVAFLIFSYITSDYCKSVPAVERGLSWLKVLIPVGMASLFLAIIFPDQAYLKQLRDSERTNNQGASEVINNVNNSGNSQNSCKD